MMNSIQEQITILGWREWISIPELGIEQIKVKIDTGARTSSIHAFFVDPYYQDQQLRVRFGVHPEQDNTDNSIECDAPVVNQRLVSDSGGHEENRYFILTTLVIGNNQFKTEVNLTNRDTMKFRMLLGRTAMVNRFIVDPLQSYLQGAPALTEQTG